MAAQKIIFKYDDTYSDKALGKISSFDVSSVDLDPCALLSLRRRNFKIIIGFFTKGNCSIFSDKYNFTRSSLASLLSGKILFTQSYATKITKAVCVPINTIDILEEDVLLQVLLDNVSDENDEFVPELNTFYNSNYPLEHPNNRIVASQRLFELKKAIRYLDIINEYPVSGYEANTSLSSTMEDVASAQEFSRNLLGAKKPLNSPYAQFSSNVKTANAMKMNSYSGFEPDTRGYFLELLDVEASAGPGTFTEGYVGSEQIFISDYEYYRYLSGENPDNLKAIKVRGDSMEPMLKNGQTCVVRMGNNFTNQGIYVFTYGSVTYIKRLNQASNNTLIAISENPVYPPFIIDDIDRLVIHGKLVLALEYTKI